VEVHRAPRGGDGGDLVVRLLDDLADLELRDGAVGLGLGVVELDERGVREGHGLLLVGIRLTA